MFDFLQAGYLVSKQTNTPTPQMFFRSLFAALTIAAASFAPAAVATTGSESAARLGRSVLETGLDFYVKCPANTKYHGMYSPTEGAFVVCAGGKLPINFNAEQQDTLRHEAIHVAQDCVDGQLGNQLETTSYISTLMKTVAASGIDATAIEATYRENGADDHTILLELEAFSLAASLTNDEVNGLLRKVCRLPV